MTNAIKMNTYSQVNYAASAMRNINLTKQTKFIQKNIHVNVRNLFERKIKKIDITLKNFVNALQNNICKTLKLAKTLGIKNIQADLNIIEELNITLNDLNAQYNRLPHNHEAKEIRKNIIDVAALLDRNVNLLLNVIENTL